MWKRLLIALSVFVSCIAAQAVSAATVDSTIHFRISKNTDHLEFVWKRYPHPSAFASYFIVRSEPGGPSAPEAGDIVATTTNRYSTNAQDKPDHNGKYYYRLCVNKKDGGIVCSRVASAIVSHAVAKAALASAPTVMPTIAPPVGPTTTDPVVPVRDASPVEMALSLSPSASGTILTWTPAKTLPGTFVSYALVRSFTTSTPSYPNDGYLAKIRDVSTASFMDTIYVDPAFFHAQRWYRVCAVDASGSVTCGNSVAVTP